MANPSQYESSVDFRISSKPPQIRTLVDANQTIAIIYNTIQQIIRALIPTLGISKGILTLPGYTLTTLPSVTANTGNICVVTNGTSNKWLVYSNGTNWLYTDGTIAA